MLNVNLEDMNFLASMNVFTSSFAVIVIFLSEMMNRCEHVFFIIINVIIDERYYFNAGDFFQETSEILVERIFEMIFSRLTTRSRNFKLREKDVS